MPFCETNHFAHVLEIRVGEFGFGSTQNLYDSSSACVSDAFRETARWSLPADSPALGRIQPFFKFGSSHVDRCCEL